MNNLSIKRAVASPEAPELLLLGSRFKIFVFFCPSVLKKFLDTLLLSGGELLKMSYVFLQLCTLHFVTIDLCFVSKIVRSISPYLSLSMPSLMQNYAFHMSLTLCKITLSHVLHALQNQVLHLSRPLCGGISKINIKL